MPDTTPNDDTTLDLLLGRILDRRAAPADWEAFATLASARPDAWPALLTSLRTEQGLVHGAAAELAVAESVDLPAAALAAAEAAPPAPVHSLAAARGRRPWVGWAAAALLAVAWSGSEWIAPSRSAGSPDSATPPRPALRVAEPAPLLAAADSAAGPRLRDDAVADPQDGTDVQDLRGAIVGQLPLQLVSTRTAADGNGLDVVYVRPVLEQTRVSGLYALGATELGQPAPVSLNPASYLLADSN